MNLTTVVTEFALIELKRASSSHTKRQRLCYLCASVREFDCDRSQR